jgi:hypothetical protein
MIINLGCPPSQSAYVEQYFTLSLLDHNSSYLINILKICMSISSFINAERVVSWSLNIWNILYNTRLKIELKSPH